MEVFVPPKNCLCPPQSRYPGAGHDLQIAKTFFLRYSPKMQVFSRTNDLLAIWSLTTARTLQEGQYIHQCIAK